MAAAVQVQGALSFSVASVVEDVLQQHGNGNRSRDLDLDARRAEEDAMRRCEAAAWLRKVVGVVAAKDLPEEPTDEEFRLGLRSGIILCNALNKVQPGSVPKVVGGPCDSVQVPDGAALSAYQYFENVRNFLVAVEDMGVPNFEASDLEQGGKTSRVVNCVLAIKSYYEWKQAGGNGVWKFGGNVKTTTAGKQFARKNSEPFAGSLSRSASIQDKSLSSASAEAGLNRMPNSSLSMLVHSILLDKKPEEVPSLVESVLSKVVEEFEHRIASHVESNKPCFRDSVITHGNKSMSTPSPNNVKLEQKSTEISKKKAVYDREAESKLLKQQLIVDQQQSDIKELKQTVSTAKAGMQFMQMKFHEEIHNLGLHVHGLAHAASGYHRVLDENRKLYNQVQDLKGSIRVYCRVRPFLTGQYNYLSTVDHIEEGTITINTLVKNGKGRKSFNFNKLFGPAATQEEVFSDTQPLIRSVLDGYNVCIFAYGQTGSGKTYTMTGPRDLTEHNQGVNYRALRDLFLLAEQRKDTFSYDVSVQMIEIYNEQVRDLLSTDGSNKRLEIRNSSQTGLSVPDASLFRVSSTSDTIDLMSLGQRNRAVGATALNDRSSRSHSCLTVHVQGRDVISGSIIRGCMHLVDLAGSERVDKSEVTGDRLKEAQHINKSLSALGDVISSLAQKNSHVPYRNSKLTQLLQDSLGGQAKTLMFVHISPEQDAIGETISTLKFAERVATVELGAARVNRDSSDVKELKEQIASLKAALARKDSERKIQPLLPPPFQSNINVRDAGLLHPPPNGLRKSTEEVGNIEVHRKSKSRLRQKRQSLDLDELLGNTSMWPPVPVNSSSQAIRPNGGHQEEDDYNFNEDDDNDDERDVSSSEWVDKLMVNKQDSSHGIIPNNVVPRGMGGCWGSNSSSDVIYQKYLSDRSFGVFPSMVNNDNEELGDEGEMDGGTTCSGSSEPDLLWQFNGHSKHGSFSSSSTISIDQKVSIVPSNSKQNKSPEFRMSISKMGPPASPSRKAGNESLPVAPRTGRQVTNAERKGKTRTKK